MNSDMRTYIATAQNDMKALHDQAVLINQEMATSKAVLQDASNLFAAMKQEIDDTRQDIIASVQTKFTLQDQELDGKTEAKLKLVHEYVVKLEEQLRKEMDAKVTGEKGADPWQPTVPVQAAAVPTPGTPTAGGSAPSVAPWYAGPPGIPVTGG